MLDVAMSIGTTPSTLMRWENGTTKNVVAVIEGWELAISKLEICDRKTY